MPVRYTAQLGDCVSSVAFEHGFFPDTVWQHGENRELKELRGDPYVLCEGDVIFVPDVRVKKVSLATGKQHTFKRKGVPEVLRIRFVDAEGKPRAGVKYRLT